MPMNSRELICNNCKRYLKKIRSGVTIRVEAMQGIQNCDLWQCGGCGAQILTGFGNEHDFGEHNEEIYIERLRW